MTLTTFANQVQQLQTDVLNILRADTTSYSFTNADGSTVTQSLSQLKIVDGVPSDLIRTEAFPFIIVHTPEVEERRLTLRKFRDELTVHIEIADRREKAVRVLTDMVKQALYASENTTKADGFTWFGRRVRSNLNYTFLQKDTGKPVWHMNIFFTYFWTGS